ncbi:MAG: hypothetical protein AB2A00_23160 [Myxococcota bacterium]
MWRTEEGSTGRLVQLCVAYFIFYVITGVTVKYYLGAADKGFPGMNDIEFLVYSTFGGTLVCLVVAVAAGWYRLESNSATQWGPLRFPSEFLYIIPSGVCTAVVIPTTTLMYSLPISVMVAMVIMRGSVIVISRIVDAVQIRQGILTKKVYREEDIAIGFALMAVGVHLVWARDGGFDFLTNVAAVTILSSYITAYAIRIYLMNYFKNTRGKGVKQDNKGFFAVEQIAASVVIFGITCMLFNSPDWFGWEAKQLQQLRGAFSDAKPQWPGAILSGAAFGVVAFFSVFIFMFKGRTATFAGLVNRLTSLIAGTTATLVSAGLFGGKLPKTEDWISLGFILVAVAFLTSAERKRAAELAQAKALEPTTTAAPARAA